MHLFGNCKFFEACRRILEDGRHMQRNVLAIGIPFLPRKDPQMKRLCNKTNLDYNCLPIYCVIFWIVSLFYLANSLKSSCQYLHTQLPIYKLI